MWNRWIRIRIRRLFCCQEEEGEEGGEPAGVGGGQQRGEGLPHSRPDDGGHRQAGRRPS
jgi:hypothetical protein